MIKRVIAEWYIKCDVTCPHCYHDNDILERVEELGVKPGTSKSLSLDIECEKCGGKFITNYVQK